MASNNNSTIQEQPPGDSRSHLFVGNNNYEKRTLRCKDETNSEMIPDPDALAKESTWI